MDEIERVRDRLHDNWLAVGDWAVRLSVAEGTGDVLAVVAFWKTTADDAQDRTAEAVVAARASGCTWAQVAGALGVTKQSAWVMYRSQERDPGPGQGPVTAA